MWVWLHCCGYSLLLPWGRGCGCGFAITCGPLFCSVTLRTTNQISQILIEDFLGNSESELIFFNPNASLVMIVAKGTARGSH